MAAAALDAGLTIRDALRLVSIVRDINPRDPLRAVDDALLDLATKAAERQAEPCA